VEIFACERLGGALLSFVSVNERRNEMTLFGWTFDEWACAFHWHPVRGEITFKKALRTRNAWMRRNFGASPQPSAIALLGTTQIKYDFEAATALFKLPLTSQAWRV
jgi:hypothetical protein